MAIEVTCSCGRRYRAGDDAAGKLIRCRDCGETIRVPASEDWEADNSSSPDQFQIDIQPCSTSRAAMGDAFLQAYRDTVIEYLEASPESFSRAQIRLAIETEQSKKQTLIRIRLTGNVNGRRLNTLVRQPIKPHVAGGGMLGWLASVAASKMIDAAMRAASGNPNLVPEVQGTCKRLLVDVFQKIDAAAGRTQSTGAANWKMWQIAAVVAAVCTFGTGYFLLSANGARPGQATVMPLFLTPMGYFLVIGIGIAAMPESFFLKEAIGRKVMRFSGANSPGGARIVAMITAVVMLALIIGVLSLEISIVKEAKP